MGCRFAKGPRPSRSPLTKLNVLTPGKTRISTERDVRRCRAVMQGLPEGLGGFAGGRRSFGCWEGPSTLSSAAKPTRMRDRWPRPVGEGPRNDIDTEVRGGGNTRARVHEPRRCDRRADVDVRLWLRPPDGGGHWRGNGTLPGHPARAHDLRDVRASVVAADRGGRSGGAVLQRHHKVRRLL